MCIYSICSRFGSRPSVPSSLTDHRVTHMEGALRASIEFVNAAIAAGTDGVALEALRGTQVNSLKMQFSRTRSDMPDATRAMSLLGASPFTTDQRTMLLTAVQSSVAGSGDGESADNSKAQTNIYIYNYGPESFWTFILNKTKSEDERLNACVDLMHLMGLRYPDAHTKKVLVSMLVCAMGSHVSHQAAHRMLCALTQLNNRKRILRKDEALTVRVFPENVNDFLTIHGSRYPPDGQPVECRIDHRLIQDTVAFVSARKSNILLRGSTGPMDTLVIAPGASAMQMGNPQMQMQGMMQAAMQNFFAQMLPGLVNGGGGGGADRGNSSSMGGITFNTPSKGSAMRKFNRSSPFWVDPNADQASPPEDSQHASEGSQQSPPAHADGGGGNAGGNNGEEAEADECDEKAEDDIDSMLNGKVPPPTAMKAVKASPKAATKAMKAMKTTPKAMKVTPTPKAASKVMKAPKAKAEPTVYKTRPKLGEALPLVYKGCKVYEGSRVYKGCKGNIFRVVPRPNESAYDKAFSYFKSSKAEAWQELLKFCENPTIPKTSANYIV